MSAQGADVKQKKEMSKRKTKSKVFYKVKAAVFIAVAAWNINSFAQVEPVIQVMKHGSVVPVTGIDQIIFDGATAGEVLVVHKNDGSPIETMLLNEIQQIYFSDESVSVETLSGNKVYELNNVAKLLFDHGGTTGINNPATPNSPEVFVQISPTGDVIVESLVAIKSLTLFSVEGKMIFTQHGNSKDKQFAFSLQDNAAGVYLLQVETEQGTVVKKVVKPLNK